MNDGILPSVRISLIPTLCQSATFKRSLPMERRALVSLRFAVDPMVRASTKTHLYSPVHSCLKFSAVLLSEWFQKRILWGDVAEEFWR